MRKVKNEQTGIEEIQFGAKLISISDKAMENSNKKNYKVATIEFDDINSVPTRTSALVYEGNYQYGVEIGETYLSVAIPMEDGGVIVRMSHLIYNGARPTADMFGFEIVEETSGTVLEPNKEFEVQQ